MSSQLRNPKTRLKRIFLIMTGFLVSACSVPPNARDQLRDETGAHLARPLSGRCGAEPGQQGACPAGPSAASRCWAAADWGSVRHLQYLIEQVTLIAGKERREIASVDTACPPDHCLTIR